MAIYFDNNSPIHISELLTTFNYVLPTKDGQCLYIRPQAKIKIFIKLEIILQLRVCMGTDF